MHNISEKMKNATKRQSMIWKSRASKFCTLRPLARLIARSGRSTRATRRILMVEMADVCRDFHTMLCVRSEWKWEVNVKTEADEVSWSRLKRRERRRRTGASKRRAPRWPPAGRAGWSPSDRKRPYAGWTRTRSSARPGDGDWLLIIILYWI